MTDLLQSTEQPLSQDREPTYTISLHTASKVGKLHMTMGIPEGKDARSLEKSQVVEESVFRFVELLSGLDVPVDLTPSRQPRPEETQFNGHPPSLFLHLSINKYERNFGHLATASTILKRTLEEERAHKPDLLPTASHKVLLFMVDHLDASLLVDFFDTEVQTDFVRTLSIRHIARRHETLPRIVVKMQVLYEPFLHIQRQSTYEKDFIPAVCLDDRMNMILELPPGLSPKDFRMLMRGYLKRVLSYIESKPEENNITSWFLEVPITHGIYKALALLDEPHGI